MTIYIRRTKHLDQCDLDRIDPRNDAIMKLLNNKLIIRATDTIECAKQMEVVFLWLRDNCRDFYSVRGPESDKNTVKYIIYFMNEEEMSLFAMSFPQEPSEE